MIYRIVIRTSFSSSHRVRLSSGEWEPVHEHNYNVEVCVRGSNLNENGMLMDFFELKKIVDEVISNLSCSYLNENFIFRDAIPTAENIAKFIFQQVSSRISLEVDYVKLWETDEFGVIVSSE